MARGKPVVRWREAERHLAALDRRWAQRIERVGPCSLRPRRDHFGTLVRSIVSQQISTHAARTINERLERLTGGRHHPDRILRHEVDVLRTAGLSLAKATYVRNLAEAVARNELTLSRPGRFSDDDLILKLTAVKGIGRWTAEMFLIFSLNRPDILPVGDLGVRSGIKSHFGLDAVPTPTECVRLTENWRPYRSIASWYLWREVDLQRTQAREAAKSGN